MTYNEDNEINESYESKFEELASQMYYDEENVKDDGLFSVSVFQVTVCIILTAVIFLMSLMGGYKVEVVKAIDYFQSFEIKKDEVKQEIEAMKNFLTDAQV